MQFAIKNAAIEPNITPEIYPPTTFLSLAVKAFGIANTIKAEAPIEATFIKCCK